MQEKIEHYRKGTVVDLSLSLSPGTRGISLPEIWRSAVGHLRNIQQANIYIRTHQRRPRNPIESVDSRTFESEVCVSLCVRTIRSTM